MRREYLYSGILSAVLAAAAVIALAQTGGAVFPVSELGGCASKEECRVYCDLREHAKACVDYAEAHGLFSKDEALKARALVNAKGPGGCAGEECKTYCEDVSHRDACYSFAKEKGLLSKEKSDEYERQKNSLKKSSGPGGCAAPDACAAYCSDQTHLEECLSFGVKSGLITGSEAVNIKKLSGHGPGGCQGDSCKAYCDIESHVEECLNFARDNGLITKDNAEKARILLNITGPGGCKGEECKTYCENEAHLDECRVFAKEHGLISKEETDKAARAEQIIKAVQKNGGPGGCQGVSDCREYCSDRAHADECLEFTLKNSSVNTDSFKKKYEELRSIISPPKLNGPGGCDTPQSCFEYCGQSDSLVKCAKTFREPAPEIKIWSDDGSSEAAENDCARSPGGCQTLPPETLPPASGSSGGSEAPTDNSKEDLIKFIEENCAKYNGVLDGSTCIPASVNQPAEPEDSPSTLNTHESFIGTILDMVVWLFGKN